MSRQGIMLCYPFEEKRLAKWRPPYIVQPKLDGERCRILPEGLMLSSELNSFNFAVPHILNSYFAQDLLHELDGELYRHGWDFEDIHSVVSRKIERHPHYEKIQYHVFDLVTSDPQAIRLQKLNNLNLQPPFYRVPYRICSTLEEIFEAKQSFVDEGYEGIIIRHLEAFYERKRSTYVMKFKPKKEDWYQIIGYQEEKDKYGNTKNSLGAVICRGDDGTEFRVGSGFTKDDRLRYWKDRESLIGRLCHVEYQHTTSSRGVPRFPVFVSIGDPAESIDPSSVFGGLL